MELNHTCQGENHLNSDACLACAAKDCPFNEPLHYHHDGCPACDLED